jgi:hypothetical protein
MKTDLTTSTMTLTMMRTTTRRTMRTTMMTTTKTTTIKMDNNAIIFNNIIISICTALRAN